MTRFYRALGAVLIGTSIAVVPASPAAADDIRDSQWMIDSLDTAAAHEFNKGEGVTVGLVDTGVDDTHPDLTGQVVGGYDSWHESGDGTTDVLGHGTAMASLIAGHGHGQGRADGVLGLAPEAKILSVGAMPKGDTQFKDCQALNDGIRWLADNGADVILLAYGGEQPCDDEEAAIKYATVEKNVPVVSAAGNTVIEHEFFGKSTIGLATYPGAHDEVLTVSGTTESGDFSEVAVADPKVMLAAPLEGVIAGDLNRGYDDKHGGTSHSSAIVAGTMALLRAEYPDLTRKQLAWQITETADAKGDKVPNEEYGYGIVNPAAALAALAPGAPTDPTTPDPLSDSGEPESHAAESPTDTTLAGKESSNPVVWWIVTGTVIVLAILAFVLIIRSRRVRTFDPTRAGIPSTVDDDSRSRL